MRKPRPLPNAPIRRQTAVMPPPFTLLAPDGATLSVRVTPKASRSVATGVVPLDNGTTALALRIAAPPVDGAANAEVVRFLAKTLGVAKGKITIVKGETGRVKQVRIIGDPADLAIKLQALTAG